MHGPDTSTCSDLFSVGSADSTAGLPLCRGRGGAGASRSARRRQRNGGVASPAVAPSSCFLCGRAAMAVGRPQALEHPPENGFTPLEQPVPRLLPHIDGSVLPSVGGFGKHQKQLVVLTWIPALFIGFSQFSDYFLLAQPNGTCVQPTGNHSNWTGPFPSGSRGGDAPAPPLNGNGSAGEGDGDGQMLCACKEWRLELQTGLSQNVVTKVTSAHQIELHRAPSPPPPAPPSFSTMTASDAHTAAADD